MLCPNLETVLKQYPRPKFNLHDLSLMEKQVKAPMLRTSNEIDLGNQKIKWNTFLNLSEKAFIMAALNSTPSVLQAFFNDCPV